MASLADLKKELAAANGHTDQIAIDVVDLGDAYEGWIESGDVWSAGADEADRPPLIRGVLAAEALAMVGGEPKVGKTWLICDLVLSVSTGHAFMSHYPVDRPGKVLFVCTEGSRTNLGSRLMSLALGKGLDPSDAFKRIDFIWRKPVALDDDNFLDWLRGEAPNYVLIVVDVLRDAWSGEENSNDAVSKLLRGLRPITNQGPTIALVQHFGKSGPDTASRRQGQRLRGGSVFHAALDSGIYLDYAKGAARTAVTLESKDDVPVEPFSFAWPRTFVDGTKSVLLDWKEGEEVIASVQQTLTEVLTLVRERPGQTKTQIAQLTGKRKAAAMAAIDLAVSRQLVHIKPVEGMTKSGRRRTNWGLFEGNGQDPKGQDQAEVTSTTEIPDFEVPDY